MMGTLSFWNIFFVSSILCSPIIIYLTIRNFKRLAYWKKRRILYFPATPLFSKHIFNSFLIQHLFLTKVYNYGTGETCCGFFQFRKPVLLIRSPHIINLILNQEFKYFPNKRHSEYSDGNQDPLSQHLLALNGIKWKFLRAKLSPTFTSEKLRSMFSLLDKCVENFIDLISKSKEEPMDIVEVCGRLSIDSIASCAFGLELNCLRNQNHDFIRMGKAAFKAGKWQMFKSHLRILYPQLFKWLKLKAYGKDVNDFFYSLVTETIEKRKTNNEKRIDFIYLLMKMIEEDEITITEFDCTSKISKLPQFTNDLIAAQAFSFYIGGYETTSVTMSCLFYELARNEKIRQKLQYEVLSKISTASEVTYSKLQSLEYMDMVIKEVLRLHPPAFYIQRICSENFQVPGTDIIIEKEMEVVIPILQIHHDETYFDNASEFVPERFSKENKHKIKKGSYLPFGDGPRKCIGMRFSLMELKLTLAKTLVDYNFQLESKSAQYLDLEEYSRIYKLKNNVLIKFTKRIKN